ncbi:MAG TPA: tetratricopeptide repeat protein [Candidatus Eisenbacteria bacterium]|nr:tetratricopeptide repeat protein [Candidatus Eisenbacteria bacterium]
MPRRGLLAVLALLVVASAVLPYARTVGYEFVWDDPFVIGKHLDVTGPGDLVRIWNLPFDSLLKEEAVGRTYFRPAVLYSLALDRAFYGEQAGGFHATNVALYAAACFFLWLFAWQLSGMPVAAALGAILFALHPTHPESVAFVSGRTDVQGALFLFASLWAAVLFGPVEKRPIRKLLLAALLLLPGLYSKEVTLFGAPVVVLALWVRDHGLRPRDAALASIPIVAACALYLITRFAVLGPHPVPAISPVEGTLPQILTSVSVVARYLPLLFAPVRLSARHDIAPTVAPDLLFAVGLLTIAALAAGCWMLARRRSLWSVPVSLFAVTLLPVCYVRLLAGAIVAERFLFVPSAAVAVAIALAPSLRGAAPPAPAGGGKRRKPAAPGRDGAGRDAGTALLLVGGAAAVWFAILLGPRVAIWKNEGLLYTSMLRDSPESPHVHAIAGSYYYRTRDLERTAYHYRRAIELAPDRTNEFLLNLAAAEDEMGQLDSAFVHIRLLNRLEPRYGHGWYALGNLYVRADQPDSAVAAYREALRWMPDLAQAENNLGAVYERMGRMDEALAAYRRALVALPGYKEATNNLRRLSAELGRPSGLPAEP